MRLAGQRHCFPRFSRAARDGVTAEPRRVVGGSFNLGIGHDPIALALTRRQDPVVPNLMGARRWNQRHETFDELASLHEDVCGAVAPAGLQAQNEPSVRVFFESLVCERRTGDVAAEPLEASSVSRGDGHVCVEAHPAVLRHARRCLTAGYLERPDPSKASTDFARVGVARAGGPTIWEVLTVTSAAAAPSTGNFLVRAVPEPSTGLLLAAGLALLGARRIRATPSH